METPKNKDRWRELEGNDPDREQLTTAAQTLDERLNDKKEQLLEKELVLEEVTALSDRLRKQAAEGRASTLDLAKKVNDFQARIKSTTRKMMAIVSELSMYQATAMKLQQEKHDREMEVEDAVRALPSPSRNTCAEHSFVHSPAAAAVLHLCYQKWRLENNEPPTEEAEHEWYRMERERLRRTEQANLRRSQAADGGAMPQQVTRTTAEPRPNAYIPDDIGIPKPYGQLAPFKPTVAGSTMRHTRNPVPRQIEY